MIRVNWYLSTKTFATLTLLGTALLHHYSSTTNATTMSTMCTEPQQYEVCQPPHVPPVILVSNRYTSSQVVGYICQALRLTHHPRTWVKPLYWMAYQESRFYRHSVDGTPAMQADLQGNEEYAMGLFQVLPTTFQRHEMKRMGNIWNPVDNAVASIRYVVGRYGTPYKVPGVFRVSQYNGY